MPSPAPTAQPEFDFDHHLPAGMESFSTGFLASWFHTSAQHWINLIEEGHLAAVDLRSPNASKSMLRVPRAVLIAYLNRKTQ
jgi:hypothetical protein